MVQSGRMTEELRIAISNAGGLFTRAGLARHWNLSKAYVSEATDRDDFPKPAAIIDGDAGRPVWSGEDADTWRATPRKPGPKS